MKNKILRGINEDGTEERFYPITHATAVLVDPETTLDIYLKGIIANATHTHSNKDILDLVTKEFTIEKDNILTELSNKSTVKKSEYKLETNTWYTSGDITSYTLSIPGLNINSQVTLLIPDNISTEEYTAFKEADINLTNSSIGEGVLVLKAFGTKPTIDIPIYLSVRG